MLKLRDLTRLLLISGLIFQSCGIKKYIPEDERLYTGASIEIQSDSVIKKESQLKSVLKESVRPKPNKKFLGTYFGLYFYYQMQKENPGFINRFFYKRIGEEPVYQSDVQPVEVEEILINRLENRGFFYSTASYEFLERKKKAGIKYKLNIPAPYLMENYYLDSLPEPLASDILKTVKESPLKKGLRFDLANLKMERERIDRDLKEKGYYNFNPGFLIFVADTNQYDQKRFDLFLSLKDEVPEKSKIPYKISKINVYADYDIEDFEEKEKRTFNNKTFINSSHFFKPRYLDPFITLQEGNLYSSQDSKYTSRRLSTIGTYKFVTIHYRETDSLLTDSLGILEADIFLSPLKKRALRFELQGVSKSNNFAGPGLGLTYSNRNLFQGGEALHISGNFGYEFQAGGRSGRGKSSLQLGLKSDLIYPRVLFPVRINNDFFKYDIPKTRIRAGIDYQNRTRLYSLLALTGQFGYTWQANRYITHEIIPVSINYTNLLKTSTEFDSILSRNMFLKRSFEQQFIAGIYYSFTYNGMLDSHKKHQFFVNVNLDVAGNTLSLLGRKKEDSQKEFLGMAYAQYAKADLDFRYYFNFGKEQVLAARLFGGYGHPYGNSDIMPYVKQYFSGGPYSIRAFRIRSVGPGTYSDPDHDYFDRTGNIRLEANLEYRFPIISYLKGAVFADAGNIWNSRSNEVYEGKDLFTSRFIDELAMGTGVGLRVAVQGFVIRFDLAAPFHDPSEGFKFKYKEPIFNFGLGYPF